MSGVSTLSLLKQVRPGVAYGASWIPRAMGSDAGMIAARAKALGLDFVFVNADWPIATELCAALREADVVALWAVDGVVGRLARDRGWAQLIKDTASTPASLATPIAQSLSAALDQVRTGLAVGVGAVVIADDLASTAGWLLSPDFVLEAVVPCYVRLAAEVTHRGSVPVFHSDGNVAALYRALAEAGFSAIHMASIPVEKLSRVAKLVRAAGLVPIGGVEVAHLGRETAEKIAERLVRLAGDGVIALSDDGGITAVRELVTLSEALGLARATLAEE